MQVTEITWHCGCSSALREIQTKENKMLNQNPTLADLAITHPGASRIFLKHGLDFCCRGCDGDRDEAAVRSSTT